MDAEACDALWTIRSCVAADRVVLLPHFTRRMDEHVFIWADVLTVLESPAGVRSGRWDRFGRPKWMISGTATAGESVEFVCVLDTDAYGDVTVFITIY